MTEAEYVSAVPDPNLRTAISGFLMRLGWKIAMKQVKEAQVGESDGPLPWELMPPFTEPQQGDEISANRGEDWFPVNDGSSWMGLKLPLGYLLRRKKVG